MSYGGAPLGSALYGQNYRVRGTVKFDAASSSPYEAALSTYNWNHTVRVASNRILLVGVGIFATGSVTGITYNGVALTKIRSDVSGIYRSELWQLIAPATGTNSVAVTLSASLTSIAAAVSYFNADQTAIDANNGANGTNTPASASITAVVGSCRVVGVMASASASGVTSASGQNPRTTASGALGTLASDDYADLAAAGSKTLTWNGLGALDAWAVSLATVRPPQSVASTYVPYDVQHSAPFQAVMAM